MRSTSWLTLVTLLATAVPAGAEEIKHSFLGGAFPAQIFNYAGPEAGKFVKPEAEGLRIRFPVGEAPTQPVGIVWRGRPTGDFVVTAHFEVLGATPTDRGTGPELYLQINNPTLDGLPVMRSLRTDGDFWMSMHMTGDRNNRHPEGYRHVRTERENRRGKLRVARTGSVFITSFAEGDGDQFTELNRYDIGTQEVKMIRFAALTAGRKDVDLDVRLLSFDLETDPAGPPPENAPPSGRRLYLFLALLLLGAVLFLVLLVVLALTLRRRRKKPAAAATDHVSDGLPPQRKAIQVPGTKRK